MIDVSRLYLDGFLFLMNDPDLWIQNNNPADRRSVRCLELNCPTLEKIADSISSLHNLQRLELRECCQLQKLPENLGDLQSLTFLSLHGCWSMESLPNSIVNLSNLKTLDLKDCYSLTKLPAISSIFELNLHGCTSIRLLPEGLCNLGQLHLTSCTSLTELPADLNVLRHLKMETCCGMQPLPQSVCSKLELLDISLCSQRILLHNLTCFQNLTHLTLRTCRSPWCEYKVLSVNLGELCQLSLLNIQHTAIKWLPWSITKLPHLSVVLLPTGFRMETLPEHLNDSLVISVPDNHVRKTWKVLKSQIKTFSMPIIGVEEAQLFSTPRYLQHTGDPRPWIQNCNGLHVLVKILDLNLFLKKFDENTVHWIGELPQLTHLYISNAYLSVLPLTLKRITHLSLSYCHFNDAIMPCIVGLGNLSTLQSLKLLKCGELPAHIDLPVSLTHFALESDLYRPLPHSYMALMRKLSNLNTLELSKFEDLELLNFNLAKLKIVYCTIKSLPTGLQHLEIIHPNSCSDLLQVRLNQLINLQTLSLTCYNIEVLPSIARHQNLQQLHLKDCFNLKLLPRDLNKLIELCTLDVSGTRIKSLPASITELQNLRHLIVPKCFMPKSWSKDFQHKVMEDVIDDMYYEDVGYNDSRYDNEIMSGSREGGDQLVSQESSHNIITGQASLSRPLSRLPDDIQVHEGYYDSRYHSWDDNETKSCSIQGGDQLVFQQSRPHNITEQASLSRPLNPQRDTFQVHEGNYDSRYNSREGNETTSCSIQGCAQLVSQEPTPDTITEQASPTRPLNPQHDASQVHDDAPRGESDQQGIQNGGMDNTDFDNENRNPPCDSIPSGGSDKNPQGGDLKIKKTQRNNVAEDSILKCRSIQETADCREGNYDSRYNSREDNETTSCSIQGGDQLVSQLSRPDNITEQASRSWPLNPQRDAFQVHEDASQGEIQQGIQNGGMDNTDFDNENQNPPCDPIPSGGSDKNLQGGNVKLKRTKRDNISEDSILECMSNKMTIEEAAKIFGVGRATLMRRLRELNINWRKNNKRKQHEDAKNKERTIETHSKRKSSRLSLMDTSNHDRGTEPISGIGSGSTFDVKATYCKTVRIDGATHGKTVRIDGLSLSSSIEHFKVEVGKKLDIEVDKIEMEYLDTTEEWILMTEFSDLEHAKYFPEPSGRRCIRVSLAMKS